METPKLKGGYTLVAAQIMCVLNIIYINQNRILSEYQTSVEVKLWHSLNVSVFSDTEQSTSLHREWVRNGS